MANKETQCCEKFKTMIGGQALIEGIMMCGPEKDAIVVRGREGLSIEVHPRKIYAPGLIIGSKKVVGILTEMSAEFDAVEYVVTGIGV